jgi:hypothetical protein
MWSRIMLSFVKCDQIVKSLGVNYYIKNLYIVSKLRLLLSVCSKNQKKELKITKFNLKLKFLVSIFTTLFCLSKNIWNMLTKIWAQEKFSKMYSKHPLFLTFSLLDRNSVYETDNLVIVIIQLIVSLSILPKVITLSGFHCIRQSPQVILNKWREACN